MAADCASLRSEIVSTETTSDQTDKSHTLRLKHRLLVIHHCCNLHVSNQQHFNIQNTSYYAFQPPTVLIEFKYTGEGGY